MDSLHYTLSEEQTDYSKNPDKFFEISQNVLNKHAPRKKKYICGKIILPWLKRIRKPLCKEHVSETNS